MPHSSEKICICTRCGKTFTVKTGDNIKANELKRMLYCKRCRLIIFASQHNIIKH